AVQQVEPVEVRGALLAVDFLRQLVDFGLDVRLVRARVRAVVVLDAQLVHPLKHVLHVIQRTRRGLHHRNGVVGVAARLVQAVDLGGQALRDRVASGVIRGSVDAQARRKASHRLRDGVGRLQQVLLSVHRRDVRQNRQGHGEYTSVVWFGFLVPRLLLAAGYTRSYRRQAGRL